MTLIVSSIFRDSETYIDRWVRQVETLQRVSGLDVRAIVAEGDSTDDTPELLAKALADAPFDAQLLTVNHGGPKYPSFDIEDRWRQIALVCNEVMDAVCEAIMPSDRFLYVESDLVWVPDDLAVLVSDLDAMPAVAAMSLHPDGRFYDTWGHRKDGIEFVADPSFHPGLAGERYVEIDSAGSCFALNARLARWVRFSERDCILGIGRDIRGAGDRLLLDTHVSVVHP